jgi:uncharacterized membrane protein YfcA
MPTLPLPPALLALSFAIVLAAGVVRGFSGFGFSAVSVAGLSLLMSPARLVPAIFVLEVLASLSLLRGAARDVDWPWLAWLMLGNALCIPLGIAVLAWLPETPLRIVIGALLLLAALLLRCGVRLALEPTRRVRFGAGLVSGLITGTAAIGGIALAVLLSTSRMAPAALRATLIALFLFCDLYALLWAAALSFGHGAPAGLMGADTLQWALWLAPAMLAGIWLGQRSFAGTSPQRFREHVLTLLTLLALLVVLRAALGG